MATKFVTNLNLNQNQIINGSFEIVATDPATNLFDGRLIYNSTEGVIKVYKSGTGWRKDVYSIASSGTYSAALTIAESNGAVTITPNLATGSIAGLLSSSDFTKLGASTSEATASTLVIRDVNGQAKFTTPTDDAHAATKAYVDAARSGLDVKASVRAATTGPITLSGTQTVDGVTLVAGDRVLVKDQSTASTNGIYVVAAGAWSRATDADTSAEVTSGMFTFVEEGTANGDSGWVLTTDGTITLGTTALAFAQFSGAGQITAGDGLVKSGNTINAVGTTNRILVNADSIDISPNYVGQSTITTLGTITTGTWNGTTIAVANGGTGRTTFTSNGIPYGNGTSALNVTAAGTQYQVLQAGASGVPTFGAVDLGQSAAVTGTLPIARGGTNATTEAAARTNLAAGTAPGAGVSTPSLARKVAMTLGNGVNTSFNIVHNFNDRDVVCEVYDASTYDTIICDIVRTDANTVTVTFSTAPASNAFRAVVIG